MVVSGRPPAGIALRSPALIPARLAANTAGIQRRGQFLMAGNWSACSAPADDLQIACPVNTGRIQDAQPITMVRLALSPRVNTRPKGVSRISKRRQIAKQAKPANLPLCRASVPVLTVP